MSGSYVADLVAPVLLSATFPFTPTCLFGSVDTSCGTAIQAEESRVQDANCSSNNAISSAAYVVLNDPLQAAWVRFGDGAYNAEHLNCNRFLDVL